MTRLTTDSTLRRALVVDATASGAMGVLLALAARTLEPMLGLPASLLRGVGVFLIPFAVLLLWLAPRAGMFHALVRLIVVGNVLWVVASILLLLSRWVSPTALGTLFVLAQAVAVMVFAYLEHRASVREISLPKAAGAAVTGR